ncbi:MAG: hypothetical protein Q7R70_06165 [Candidatus Diapherotrites archaeon]|nr:hypothetical protein [Candidatus Diapherotrites archaeon]
MNSVLNFSTIEKKEVLKFLENFPSSGVRSEFEEYRCKILDCAVVLYKSGKLLIQGNSAEKVKATILQKVSFKDELVLGIDEVGRGEGFGAFVVAGVLGKTSALRELRDSKKTAKEKIPEKARLVKKNAEWFFVEISASEIDSLRELGTTMNQIQANAVNKIIKHFEAEKAKEKFRIVVDGSKIKGIDKKAEFLTKADDLVVQCAAASIIAKDARNNSKDSGKRNTWKSKENSEKTKN